MAGVFAVLFAMLYFASGTDANNATDDINKTNGRLENALRIAEILNETKAFKKQFENLDMTTQAFYLTDSRAQPFLRSLNESVLPKDKPIIVIGYIVRLDVENNAYLGVFIDPETNQVYHIHQYATTFG